MAFEDTLNQIMAELGCTAKRLSEHSGVSMAQISRYRNGVSVPGAESDVLKKMARGLGDVAQEKNASRLTHESILEDLIKAARPPFDFGTLSRNFKMLSDVLGINAVDLSRFCNYDASNISRICSGEQKPRDPEWFVEQVSNYVARYYFSKPDQRLVFSLMGKENEAFDNPMDYQKLLQEWLSGGGLLQRLLLASFMRLTSSTSTSSFARVRLVA